MKDAFDNKVGPELAQWIRSLVPYELMTPGVPFQPPCSVQCGSVLLPNGVGVTVFSGWNAGFGAIEALVVTNEGERAEAGFDLTAGANSFGSTDEWGYVVVSPVPTDGTGTYELRGA